MNVWETIGICWVILSSGTATVALFHLAYIGASVLIRRGPLRVTETEEAPSAGATIPVVWGTESRTNVIEIKK